jgi:hypothetical protein
MRDTPSKSTRKSPITRKCEEPSSTVIYEMLELMKVEIAMFSTDGGRQSDLKDEQWKNRLSSICINFEPGSNDTVESDMQY